MIANLLATRRTNLTLVHKDGTVGSIVCDDPKEREIEQDLIDQLIQLHTTHMAQ